MSGFLARRLWQAVIVTFGVVTITFGLIHLAPGEPLAGPAESPYVSRQAIEQMRRNFGLDRPLQVQYARYLSNLARGDWGTSYTMHRPVLSALRDALPNTLLLATAALLIDFLLGVSIGTFQGMRPASKADRVWSAASLTLYSVPQFWFGLMLLLVFGEKLGWLPVGGVTDPILYPLRSTAARLMDRVVHLILPALTLGLLGAAATARYQRAAVLEVVRQDYIRAARARGLAEKAVAWRHALRNALLTSITLFGLALPLLLSGAVLVETIFAWPGMGKLAVDAINRRDYPLVNGAAILVALSVVAGNLLADLLMYRADPRLRHES